MRRVHKTHHCSDLSPGHVINKGQHKRGQKEEEGAKGCVHQVLQEGTTPEKSHFHFQGHLFHRFLQMYYIIYIIKMFITLLSSHYFILFLTLVAVKLNILS